MDTESCNSVPGLPSTMVSCKTRHSSNEDEPQVFSMENTQPTSQSFQKPFKGFTGKKKNLKKSFSTDQAKKKSNAVSHIEVPSPVDPGPPVLSKSLSMVVTINKTDEELTNKNSGKLNELIGLLSLIYALFIIIVGTLFPFIETLQVIWLNSVHNAVFQMYIYTLATITMIYLQIAQMKPKCPCNTDDEYIDDDTNNNEYVVDQPTYTNDNFRSDDCDDTGQQLTNQNHSSLACNTKFHSSLSVNNYKDPDNEFCETSTLRKAKIFDTVAPAVTAFLRINSTAQLTSHSIPSTNKRTQQELPLSGSSYAAAGQQHSSLLDEIPQVDEVRWVEEEVTEEVFIDLTQLGTIFSHHGSSFFLRIGTLLFGVGHMIFIILEMQNSFKLGTLCVLGTFWWVLLIRFLFIVVQTFVIFKNPEISINKEHEAIFKFGFMHVIATNLCIWIRTLLTEINLEAKYVNSKKNETLYKQPSQENCTDDVLETAAPYLFPFVLESSLLCISVIAVMYWTLGENKKNNIQKGLTNLFKVDVFVNDKDANTQSDSIDHETSMFEKSHRGIFAGFLLLAGVIIVIVFFNFTTAQNRAEYICLSSDLALIVLLFLAVIAGLVATNPLSFIKKPSSIDDALLIIAMFGGIIYYIAILISSIHALVEGKLKEVGLEVIRVLSSIVSLMFLVTQVVLVTSGLRRYPSKHSHLIKKPGRGAITFLVIGNIASWIFHSILSKNHDLQYTPEKMFGKIPWIILLNISLPLLLFFFFHSSVCLADIWHQAYIPLHKKLHKPTSSHEHLDEDHAICNHSSALERVRYNDDVYGSTTSNIAGHNYQQYAKGPQTLSVKNFLSPLIRSVSVSQLSQPPSQNLNYYHGSFTPLPTDSYSSLPKQRVYNKVKFPPLVNPNIKISDDNNNDCEVHM